MRVSSVISSNYRGYTKPSFDGRKMVKYIHYSKENRVKQFPDASDFPEYELRDFTPGYVPMQRIKGTYEPDILMKCEYYYADKDEYVGDYQKNRNSAIISDGNHGTITEDIVRDKNDYRTYEELGNIKKVLKHDIEDSRFKEENATTLDVVEREREKQQHYQHLIKLTDETIERGIAAMRRIYPDFVPDFMKNQDASEEDNKIDS